MNLVNLWTSFLDLWTSSSRNIWLLYYSTVTFPIIFSSSHIASSNRSISKIKVHFALNSQYTRQYNRKFEGQENSRQIIEALFHGGAVTMETPLCVNSIPGLARITERGFWTVLPLLRIEAPCYLGILF